MHPKRKRERRERIRRRVRKKIFGTKERPRLSVFRSNLNISAQVIDDEKGHTIVSASTLEKEAKKVLKRGSNIEAAKYIGKLIAERSLAANVKAVVLDRGPYRYNGRIKALAEAAREAGLQF
ncbi:MAG: 50S ribosomal protein L18 [Planctomycetota bacterium]|nr:50S ribosomal protein L18 [Planctomycetota bacterium]